MSRGVQGWLEKLTPCSYLGGSRCQPTPGPVLRPWRGQLRAGLPTGAVGLRDPLRIAVHATELALKRLPRMSAQSRSGQRDR